MAASKFHHRTEVLSSTAESEAKDLFRSAGSAAVYIISFITYQVH